MKSDVIYSERTIIAYLHIVNLELSHDINDVKSNFLENIS